MNSQISEIFSSELPIGKRRKIHRKGEKMVSISILEKNIQHTMTWVYAIEEECNWEEDNKKEAFTALRVVLRELRDLLPLETAIHLSAQLPLLIRGLFFENWSTQVNQPKIRKKEDFLASIADGLFSYPDADPEIITRSVLKVLSDKISAGELEKIIAVLPTDIKDLFD